MQAFSAHNRFDPLTLSCGLALLIALAVDLLAPLRLSMTVVYVGLLLLLWCRQRSSPIAAMAMLVTAATALDLAVHAQQMDQVSVAAAAINELAVWLTAGFV